MAETFVDQDLSGARFVNTLLSGAVLRGVAADGLDLDDPWLVREGSRGARSAASPCAR